MPEISTIDQYVTNHLGEKIHTSKKQEINTVKLSFDSDMNPAIEGDKGFYEASAVIFLALSKLGLAATADTKMQLRYTIEDSKLKAIKIDFGAITDDDSD
jgi:hypothetical protein